MYGDFASQEKRRSQENKSQVFIIIIVKLKSLNCCWSTMILVIMITQTSGVLGTTHVV